jgi:hypothetical protein
MFNYYLYVYEENTIYIVCVGYYGILVCACKVRIFHYNLGMVVQISEITTNFVLEVWK